MIIKIEPSGDRDTDQLNTAKAVIEAMAKYQYILLYASTGSGKTRIARLIQELSGLKMTALVNTIANQDNYRSEGFNLIKGGKNYPCALLGEQADDCPFQRRTDCPVCPQCELERAANAFKYSLKGVANYAYFFTRNFTVPEPRGDNATQTEVLFLDEAHTLIPALTDETEVILSYDELKSMDILHRTLQRQDDSGYELLCSAIDESLPPMRRELEVLRNLRKEKQTKPSRQERALSGLINRLTKIGNQVAPVHIDWNKEGVRTKSFVPMPLDRVFDGYEVPVILATGTFGAYDKFTKLLEIDNYCVVEYPDRFTPEQCFVKSVYSGAIEFRTDEGDMLAQATAIADTIKGIQQVGTHKHGLILVNSYAQAVALRDRLKAQLHWSEMEFVSQPQGLSSSHVVSWWQNQMLMFDHVCLISPTLWEGYDGTLERFCILAKAPFPNLKDAYISAR